MSWLWTSAEIAAATKGKASADFGVSGVAFDSREVGEGDFFIALKGENSDGHGYLAQAFAQGASGALVSEDCEGPHVRVADTAAGLDALAKAARARCDGVIVGVTGSAGKTGTKEALAAALARMAPGRVHRSVKSYNNHVGVPLSLSRMPRDSRFAVLEMGMNHPGELRALTALVRPHIAIVTIIAPAHVEFFRDEADIADAKAEIFEGLEEGGTAIIPFDSPHYERLRDAASKHAARIVSFGLGEGADVRALDRVDAPGGGTMVTARIGEKLVCYTIASPGEHWVANSLAVMAAVDAAGGDLAAAGLALAELEGLVGRGKRHKIRVQGGDMLLIDESYNANPASMAVTIGQLGREPAERRIAVLGGMKELGRRSDELHVGLAGPLAEAKVDLAILVGPELAVLADALDGGKAGPGAWRHCDDVDAALDMVRQEMRAGDAILVKGSNMTGLSRLVTAFTDGET